MARLRLKNLTAAIRAPFRSRLGTEQTVANTSNSPNIAASWAADNGFEYRHANAAGTDEVRTLSLNSSNQPLFAEELGRQARKTVSWEIQDNGSIATQSFFIADQAYRVVAITWMHVTQSSVGGTAQVEKTPTGTAPGSGTTLMSGTFSLTAANTTVQTATLTTTNTGDSDNPDLQLKQGDRLSIVIAGTITSLAGVTCTVTLAPGGTARTVQYYVNANADMVQGQYFFVANRPYIVSRVDIAYSTKSSVAGLKLTVTKDTSTTAPGGGTSLLTDNTNAGPLVTQTANTIYTGTLTATAATLRLAQGDRLSIEFSGGTLTALVGLVVTVTLQELAADRKEVQWFLDHVPGVATLVGIVANAVFIADRDYEVLDIRENHNIIGTDGGAVTIGVTAENGTTAPGSGTALLTADFSIKASARTTQIGTLATLGNRFLATGDRLSINPTGTFTSAAGVAITIALAPR